MKILLVEDEAAMVDALQRGLAAEGFVTEVATNGIDGLWMAEENEFDVIVLDIMLPGLSGYEVCRRLRAGGSKMPILMLTVKDGEGRRIRRGRCVGPRSGRLFVETVFLCGSPRSPSCALATGPHRT